MSEYEHRVVKHFVDGSTSQHGQGESATDAGQSFRHVAKSLYPGESVEIQRREVSSWEVVERREDKP